MIHDQRSMLAGTHPRSVTEVRESWKRWGWANGFSERDGATTLLDATGLPPLVGYVNQGRWVADCASCRGGVAGWPEHELGACLSCGRVWRITYPENTPAIEALLGPRPLRNRNFDPRKGETVESLEEENRLFLPLVGEPLLDAWGV